MLQKIAENKKKILRVCFYLILLFIVLVRLPLINKGHMHFGDELRYRYAFAVIDEISQGNIREGLKYLYHAHSRPGFILLSTIPAGIQRIFDKDVGKGDVSNDRLSSYGIVSIFNILLILGICLYFYKIILLLTRDEPLAVFAMFIFSLFNLNFMFLRHTTPYYINIFLFLFMLYDVMKQGAHPKFSAKRLLIYGIGIGFMFTVYPGQYIIFPIVAAFIFFISKNKLQTAFLLAAGFFIPVLIFEAVSTQTTLPYLFNREKIKAIDAFAAGYAGGWKETLLFPFRFFAGVQGPAGYVFAGLFSLFIVILFRNKDIDRRIRVLILSFFLLYLLCVAETYFFNWFSMRPRRFYPFMVIMAMGVFLMLSGIKKRRALIFSGIFLIMLPTFLFCYNKYLHLTYPRDIRENIKEAYPDQDIIYTSEFYPKFMQNMAFQIAVRDKVDMIGVNIRTTMNTNKNNIIDIDKNLEIMYYPQVDTAFAPYGARGLWCSKEEEDLYRMRVYKLK